MLELIYNVYTNTFQFLASVKIVTMNLKVQTDISTDLSPNIKKEGSESICYSLTLGTLLYTELLLSWFPLRQRGVGKRTG